MQILKTNWADEPICPVCDETMERRELYDPLDIEHYPKGDFICTDCQTAAQRKPVEKWTLSEEE